MAKKGSSSDRPKPTLNRLFNLQILPGTTVPHFQQTKFLRCVAHIAMIFLRQLRDERRYVLDGSTLVFIYFGLPVSHAELLGQQMYCINKKGKWSAACIPKFDFDKFLELDDHAQDELTTDLLEKALLVAAKCSGAEAQPIREAARLVRSGDFSARFLIPHLTCRDKTACRTARVWSCVSRGGIRWQVEITMDDGSVIHQELIPENIANDPQVEESRVTACWDKKCFVIRTQSKKTIYRFSGPG